MTQRAANQLRSEELRKKKELQAQVDKASIQSLTEQVTQDVEALKVYDKSLAEAKELWGDMVQSYKRNRRNKGLTRVDEIMNTRLSVQTLEVGGPNGGFKSIPRHYGLFKSGAAKDMDLKDIVDADTCPAHVSKAITCLSFATRTYLIAEHFFERPQVPIKGDDLRHRPRFQNPSAPQHSRDDQGCR